MGSWPLEDGDEGEVIGHKPRDTWGTSSWKRQENVPWVC